MVKSRAAEVPRAIAGHSGKLANCTLHQAIAGLNLGDVITRLHTSPAVMDQDKRLLGMAFRRGEERPERGILVKIDL